MLKNMATFYFLILTSGLPALGQTESSCDAEAESKREKEMIACSKLNKRSEMAWKSLEEAKGALVKSFNEKKREVLVPFLGCDADDSSRLDTICLEDIEKLELKHIVELSDKLPSKINIDKKNLKWVNFGPDKSFYVLCAKGISYKASKNHCDESGELQPIAEVRKLNKTFYLSGLPLSVMPKK